MHNRHFTARLGVMEPGWACGDGSPPGGLEMGDLVGFTMPRDSNTTPQQLLIGFYFVLTEDGMRILHLQKVVPIDLNG